MPAIEIDRSHHLIAVIRLSKAHSDEEFRQYLDTYLAILQSPARFGAVFVTSPQLSMPSPRQVRMQIQFMKDQHALMAAQVVGVAFALPSTLLRGALRGLLTIQPMPCPFTVVSTELDGVSWVKTQLWAAHVRRLMVD